MSDTPTQAIGTIHLHKQGHVGTIVFDNQAKFNAMNYDMWVGLPRFIQDCVDDHDIRLIVLTGAGEKAFVSGADISQFGERRSGGCRSSATDEQLSTGDRVVGHPDDLLL